MTDSEQKSGGLPTVEEAFECPRCGEVRKTDEDITRHIATSHNDKVLVPEKIKLVRPKDVKALIQDKIRQAEEKIEKNNAFDRLNLNDAKARKQELESLLEELEQ